MATIRPRRERVIFRVWRTKQLLDATVIALFPDIPFDREGHVTSYEHVGQHGGADYAHVIRATRPANQSEYAALKRELEDQIGYRLKVVKRR